MAKRIDLPQTPRGDAEEQLRTLYSYLYQMAETLNNNLAEIGGAELTDEERVQLKSVIGDGKLPEGQMNEAETLKSLIVKTANFVQSTLTEYRINLLGEYVADGKFGKYVRRTGLDVDVTPTGIQQNFTFQEIIQGLKTYEINAKNYIKTGLLRTVSSIPVYGVAIGKDVVTFAEDGTETYNDGNKVAELTADELSFWQSGYKVASYTGNKISFLYSGSEVMYIQNGKIYVSGDFEIITGKKMIIKSGAQLIIESGNLELDANGNLTINGGGTFAGDLSAAGGTFEGELSAATGTFAGKLKVSDWEFGNKGQINEKTISTNNVAQFRLKSDSEALDNAKHNCGISYGFDQQQWSAYSAFVPYITLYGGFKDVSGRVADLRFTFHPRNQATGYQTVEMDTVEEETWLDIKANEVYPKTIPGYTFYTYCGREDHKWDYGYFNNIYYTNLTQSSSKEIKHDIEDMEPVGEKLDRLRPVTFIYDDDPEEKRRAGLIYEETAEVLPEICTGDESAKAISYVEMIPMLLKEIQELRARVKALEEREGGN